MTILPDMPRWIPSSGPGERERPVPDVSHHMLLPVRLARVSRRPSNAALISPGGCGRHSYVSRSSTSTILRFSAARSMTTRADSTSGSSGTVPGYGSSRRRQYRLAGWDGQGHHGVVKLKLDLHEIYDRGGEI